MLCLCWMPLNASATAASLPLPHHQHPSRAAGSFFGQFAPNPAVHSARRSSRKQTFAQVPLAECPGD